MNKVCVALFGLMMAAAAMPSADSVPAPVAQAACAVGSGAEALIGIACETLADDGIYRDVWEFSGTAGAEAHYFIDSVDSGVDLRARVCAVWTGTSGSFCGLFGDDETECTIEPPGGYACPEETGALPTDSDGDGIYYLIIGAWSDPFYSGPFPHKYAGSIEVDGLFPAISLVADDDP